MTYVLAIDQGTSGTKAIVVDEAGQVISIAEIALRPDYLPGGGVEQDPEALSPPWSTPDAAPWTRPG